MPRAALLALVLVALTAAVFGQTLGFDFVLFDDDEYLLENARIAGGLSWENLGWAFSTGYMSNWHPLTWLSFLLDFELHGLDPAGYHATNLLLHTANTLLVFALLRAATGLEWRSFLVAALFAVHPLHVEAVAWVSERKGLLAAFFGLLSLWCYVSWTQRGGALRYAGVAVCLGLGLTAKAAVVTLPCAMLLLDAWPLRRSAKWWPLVREKLPLLGIVAVACVLTFRAQGGMMAAAAEVPLHLRLANASYAAVWYAAKALWSGGLAAHHPHPYLAFEGGKPLSGWVIAGSLALLAALSVAAWRTRERAPYWLVGWLFYLGSLVPVIGLVQVGLQGLAERYAYLPLLGLLLAGVWGAADLAQAAASRAPMLRRLGPALAGALLLVYAGAATAQTRYWRNTVTLFERAHAVHPEGRVVNVHLGLAYQAAGEPARAIPHFEQALRADPNFPLAHFHRALAHTQLREWPLAERHYRHALALTPDVPEVHTNLAGVLLMQGRADEAIPHYERAVALRPNDPRARANLESARRRAGTGPP